MASGSKQTTIRLGKGREQTLEYLKEATGESTNTGALFVAAEHYMNDRRNKEEIADDLSREHLEALSTPELPLERGETRVGPFDD